MCRVISNAHLRGGEKAARSMTSTRLSRSYVVAGNRHTLAADGLSNREVAGQLGVSIRTTRWLCSCTATHHCVLVTHRPETAHR
jgi:hypothetical protein